MDFKKDATENLGSSRCSASLRRKIEAKLRRIAKETQELHDLARTEMPDAYVYFESAGMVHVMDGNGVENIVASSPFFMFDCGAW